VLTKGIFLAIIWILFIIFIAGLIIYEIIDENILKQRRYKKNHNELAFLIKTTESTIKEICNSYFKNKNIKIFSIDYYYEPFKDNIDEIGLQINLESKEKINSIYNNPIKMILPKIMLENIYKNTDKVKLWIYNELKKNKKT
jgi:uncharacterized protein YpmS